MRRFVALICSVIPVIMSSGCAAGANYLCAEKAGPKAIQNGGVIFGGTMLDLAIAASICKEVVHPDESTSSPWNFVECACMASLVTIDLPMSMVGDTILLPYSIGHTLQCRSLARAADERDRLAREKAKKKELSGSTEPEAE